MNKHTQKPISNNHKTKMPPNDDTKLVVGDGTGCSLISGELQMRSSSVLNNVDENNKIQYSNGVDDHSNGSSSLQNKKR